MTSLTLPVDPTPCRVTDHDVIHYYFVVDGSFHNLRCELTHVTSFAMDRAHLWVIKPKIFQIFHKWLPHQNSDNSSLPTSGYTSPFTTDDTISL